MDKSRLPTISKKGNLPAIEPGLLNSEAGKIFTLNLRTKINNYAKQSLRLCAGKSVYFSQAGTTSSLKTTNKKGLFISE